MYRFFQSCTNSVVLICIFLKAVQPLKSCTTNEKSCTSLVHCSWLLILFTMVFAQNAQFFPKLYKFCGPHMYISKKLYNQTKKLYIFGTLLLALNFIDNGLCTEMYIFLQTCTNSVVVISIFLKSCTTIKKLYNHKKAVDFWYTVLGS